MGVGELTRRWALGTETDACSPQSLLHGVVHAHTGQRIVKKRRNQEVLLWKGGGHNQLRQGFLAVLNDNFGQFAAMIIIRQQIAQASHCGG